MISRTELTIANFGYFAFHPLSEQLSPTDQKIALIGTILLGLTCGIGHLICRLFFYDRKIDKINSNGSRETVESQNSIRSPPSLEQTVRLDTELQINVTENSPNPNRSILEQKIPEPEQTVRLDTELQINVTENSPNPNQSILEEKIPEPEHTVCLDTKPLINFPNENMKTPAEFLLGLPQNERSFVIKRWEKSARDGDRGYMHYLRSTHNSNIISFNLEEIEQDHNLAIKQKIIENKKQWANKPEANLAFDIAHNSEYINAEIDEVMYWYAEGAKRGHYWCVKNFNELYAKNPRPSFFDITQIHQDYQKSKMQEIELYKSERKSRNSPFLTGLIASLYDQLLGTDKASALAWRERAAQEGDSMSSYELKKMHERQQALR